MRIILFIALVIFGFTAFSQPWRDSLDFARNAYKKGEFEKALRYYESAQKKAPNGVDLSDEMAQSAYKAREFEKAEKIYQQSASSKKDQTSKSRSYHNLGNSRMKKKDYQGAVDAYKEALRNDPKNEKTRYNLSEAIRKLKEEQQKQQQQDQKQDKKDQQNQDQDQKNKNDQDQNKGKEQDQQQNKQQQNKGNKGENKNQQGGKSGNPSSLPNKSVERMLDELMKAEAATKRKAGGNKNGSTSTKSGKDW
jgi:Ca-activated chloride channel homolog